jgi:polar amino acid transport system substrate-binding protein
MSRNWKCQRRQCASAIALWVLAMPWGHAQVAGLPPPLPKLVMVVSAGTASSANGVALRMIYGEVGRRIGHQIDVLPVPTPRATAMSNKGEVDGELNRVADYGNAHPNMLRINPSHFSVNFVAYGRDSIEVGNGWPALAATGWRVDYVRGCKKCETELPKVVPAERLAGANSLLLALRKLQAERSDLVVDIENEIESVMALPEFAGSKLKKRGVMESVDMHAYLHKKNAALVPKMAAALAAMKREGMLEKYKALAASAAP